MSTDKMPDAMKSEFIEAFQAKFGFGVMTASSNADAAVILGAAAWAWKASREAIEVELPDRYTEVFGAIFKDEDGEIIDFEGTVKSLESLGLKVKP